MNKRRIKGKSMKLTGLALAMIMGAMMLILPAYAQDGPGHRIEITVEGLADTTFMLAYYYNESTYTKATGKSDMNGKVVFEGEEPLDKGVYILVLDDAKSKLFDFAVYNDQYFKLYTNSEDFYRNMRVEGDQDNKLFFENLIYNAEQNMKATPFTDILENENSTDEEKAAAREEVVKINDDVIEHQNRVIGEYPGSLVASILRARQSMDFPVSLEEATDENRNERYEYFKDHFWDNIDLTNDAMLRLPFPLIQNKIEEYFEKVVMQHPDSLIREIDRIANMAKPNPETYKFVVWSLTSKYYAPPVMGLDAVFVHLSDNYFENGLMDYWADDQLKKNVLDRASKLRLSMVGMKAPDLKMQDSNFAPRSMYDIKNEYTVIYFYDPDCGHCKEETPKLVDFTKSTNFDVQVYSVCADTSMVKMKNYIQDMDMAGWVNVNGPRSYVGHYQELYDAFQTPTLYLLNEKKEIIAKKLPAERLEDFLGRYQEMGKGKLED